METSNLAFQKSSSDLAKYVGALYTVYLYNTGIMYYIEAGQLPCAQV